jgi:hypothetical protein
MPQRPRLCPSSAVVHAPFSRLTNHKWLTMVRETTERRVNHGIAYKKGLHLNNNNWIYAPTMV